MENKKIRLNKSNIPFIYNLFASKANIHDAYEYRLKINLNTGDYLVIKGHPIFPRCLLDIVNKILKERPGIPLCFIAHSNPESHQNKECDNRGHGKAFYISH